VADDDAWAELTRVWHIGDRVRGRVLNVQPFGVFVDLGVRYPGLIELPELQRSQYRDAWPGVDTDVDCVIRVLVSRETPGPQIKLWVTDPASPPDRFASKPPNAALGQVPWPPRSD
jgi:predicted RNA-binding protein with RPS1 domain